jgi:hypothetical protein
MNKNPKKHRSKKYENPPIPTIKGLTHRGGSNSIYQNHELNYSPLASRFLVRDLVGLSQLSRASSNATMVIKEALRPWDKTSRGVQKRKTTKTKTVKRPHTPTSLETTTYVGTTR